MKEKIHIHLKRYLICFILEFLIFKFFSSIFHCYEFKLIMKKVLFVVNRRKKKKHRTTKKNVKQPFYGNHTLL